MGYYNRDKAKLQKQASSSLRIPYRRRRPSEPDVQYWRRIGAGGALVTVVE